MSFIPGFRGFRVRDNNGLSLEQVAKAAPSVLSVSSADHLSERYVQIPTIAVVERLMGEGFVPVEARQGLTRIDGRREHVKHSVRLRRADMSALKVGDTVPEIILYNSHDGTSAYKLLAGLFRLACLNGMVVQIGETFRQAIPHRGKVLDQVRSSADHLVREMPALPRRVEAFQGLQLTEPQRLAFAEAAARLRWEPGEVQGRDLLRVRRFEDRGADGWRTMNVIQENLTQGGVRVTTEGENGRRTHRRAKSITAVDRDIGLNAALWTLAERFREMVEGTGQRLAA